MPSGESGIHPISNLLVVEDQQTADRSLPATPADRDLGPQGVHATFDWQAARDSTVGRMCTATLSDRPSPAHELYDQGRHRPPIARHLKTLGGPTPDEFICKI